MSPSALPAPVTIRPARPTDAAVVIDFNLRLAWETEHRRLDPGVLGAGVAAVLADIRKGVYFVAEAGGGSGGEPARVVGQCSVTYEWSDWRNGDFWWLQSVYVDADWRRQGVFRALFDHVRAAAVASRAAGLRLYVEENNVSAQATYRRHGMHPTAYRVFEIEF